MNKQEALRRLKMIKDHTSSSAFDSYQLLELIATIYIENMPNQPNQ